MKKAAGPRETNAPGERKPAEDGSNAKAGAEARHFESLERLKRTSNRVRIASATAVLAATLLSSTSFATEGGTGLSELAPAQVVQVGKRQVGRYSERTITAAFLVHQDGAQLIGYTVKPRPYERTLDLAQVKASEQGKPVQVEVRLLGPGGVCHTRRIEMKGICLEHPFGTGSHVEGDTILVHGDSVTVELPELPGYDVVELGFYRNAAQGLERKQLAAERLDATRFVPAGASLHYADVAFADRTASPSLEATAGVTTGDVYWPEDFGDTEVYRLWGDTNEVGKRINVVIVPDGYTYAERAQMITDAATFVNGCRNTEPFQRYDAFFNYILVYAYSKESGTDECDCDVIKDTAMGTGFPNSGAACGDLANRCLNYSSCDFQGPANTAAAELRAPGCDTTILMVNTPRYGGCASGRAFYNGGVPAVAVHELGHTFGGLADEYTGSTACGTIAWECNTSLNATTGAWPEWVEDLGAPREGAQYYDLCIYRPADTCRMRENWQDFCPVCNQQLALNIFGHPRIDPTAPIASFLPASPLIIPKNEEVVFWLYVRGPVGQNCVKWWIQAEEDPAPTMIPCPISSLGYAFDRQGKYTVRCELVADCPSIKPAKTGPNSDAVTWQVTVTKADAIIWFNAPLRGFDGTPKTVEFGTYPEGLTLHVTYDGSPDPPSAIGLYHVRAVVDDPEYRGSMGADLRIVPKISISDAMIVEGVSGPTHAQFAVKLNGAAPFPVSLRFATADGTATVADGDYVAANETLDFAPGETEKIIDVMVNADTKVEGDETFSVALSYESMAVIDAGTATGTIQNDDYSAVVDRHIFYNNSAWDGDDPGADARDDAAIAADKVALRPGNKASFANYTSYSHGINGIMIDITNLVGNPTVTDFTFRVGNDDNPVGWALAPAPADITVRRGAGTGGSDRVTLVWWPDNSIQQQWLEVTVKANPTTALPADDVFYFGNAIGETGNSLTDAQVNSTDVNCTRINPHFTINPAAVDDICDFNRDKLVNSTDVNLARMHTTFSVNALKLIKP